MCRASARRFCLGGVWTPLRRLSRKAGGGRLTKSPTTARFTPNFVRSCGCRAGDRQRVDLAAYSGTWRGHQSAPIHASLVDRDPERSGQGAQCAVRQPRGFNTSSVDSEDEVTLSKFAAATTCTDRRSWLIRPHKMSPTDTRCPPGKARRIGPARDTRPAQFDTPRLGRRTPRRSCKEHPSAYRSRTGSWPSLLGGMGTLR